MKKALKFLIILLLVLGFRNLEAQADMSVKGDFRKLPELAWQYTTNQPLFSSPVIDDNAIYVGGTDSIFYAIDLKSGKNIWDYKTKGSIRSTALIANNHIFFISGDGNLYCLDKTGKKVQTFYMGEDKKYDFADYHQSSPVLFDDIIYFGSGNGFIYAVNSINLELKWKFETGDVVHSAPVTDGNDIYAGSFDGYVYALKIKDGTLDWKFKTYGHEYFPKGEVQGNPTISKNLVIVGARDYNVYAIDKEKGFCQWNKTFSNGWVLSNTIYDSSLFIAGADERILASIEPETGREEWKRDMEFLMFGRPAFSRSMLYVGTTIGKLHGVDMKTGNEVWTFCTETYQQNRFKYFKEDDSYRDDIYSIIKSNEQFLDVEIELGGFFSTPAISGKYLVATSTNGSIYCLKSTD